MIDEISAQASERARTEKKAQRLAVKLILRRARVSPRAEEDTLSLINSEEKKKSKKE